MNTTIALEGAHFLAAVTPPRSRAPFNRAQLVVRGADGTLVRAQTYTDGHRIEGPAMSDDDLQGLIDAGQAMALPQPMPATEGAQLWVLRPNLPHRDRALQALQLGGVLVRAPSIGPDDSRLCVVNAAKEEATRLIDTWRDEAMDRAMAHGRRGDWASATTDAELAQALSRGLDAQVLALLALVYERTDRAQRSAGLSTMARRSRGEDFAAQMEAALERIRASVSPDAPRPGAPRPNLRAALRQRFPAQAKHLDQLYTCRLAA